VFLESSEFKTTRERALSARVKAALGTDEKDEKTEKQKEGQRERERERERESESESDLDE